MGTEKARRMLLRKIIHTVIAAKTAGKEIDRKKMEAEICIEHGVTRHKAREYIQLLVDAERLQDKEGRLCLMSDTFDDEQQNTEIND